MQVLISIKSLKLKTDKQFNYQTIFKIILH